MRHQEDKLSKATSSLFPIKIIAILEWTQSNVQQNIEQLQTPTMGVTINRKSTKAEPLPYNGSSLSHWVGGGAKMHFTGTESLPQILLFLKYKKCSAYMEAI